MNFQHTMPLLPEVEAQGLSNPVAHSVAKFSLSQLSSSPVPPRRAIRRQGPALSTPTASREGRLPAHVVSSLHSAPAQAQKHTGLGMEWRSQPRMRTESSLQTPSGGRGVVATGMDVLALEDENRALREELAHYRSSSALVAANRRQMAAVAGGGFRGPSSVSQPRQCMCDTLRAKLTRIRAELREARCESRRSSLTPEDSVLVDAEVQTSGRSRSRSASKLAALPLPPDDTTHKVGGDALSMVDASSQAVPPEPPPRCDTALQATVPSADAWVQAAPTLELVSVDSQTECWREPQPEVLPKCDSISVESQTMDWSISKAEVGTQAVSETRTCESSVQANELEKEPVLISCIGVQTTRQVFCDAAMQATPTHQLVSMDSQTECWNEPPLEEEPVDTSSVGVQTMRPVSCNVATQAIPVAMRDRYVQAEATPLAKLDRAVQAEDTTAIQQHAMLEDNLKRATDDNGKLQGKLDSMEALSRTLGNDNSALTTTLDSLREENEALSRTLGDENAALATALNSLREDHQAWKLAAQSQMLGHMTVTILCPKAECTVNDQKVIQMDSWNPGFLMDELENKVLPRFTRVFVDEGAKQTDSNSQRRPPPAAERAMQDFVKVFRERVEVMLSAPNASAAVAAAGASARMRK